MYNLEVEGAHTYHVGASGVLVHNTCAGKHHYVPRSMGSTVPYGNSILTPLSSAQHTHLHEHLSDFLKGKTKTINGHEYDMFARRGQSGSIVRSVFTKQERLSALANFIGRTMVASTCRLSWMSSDIRFKMDFSMNKLRWLTGSDQRASFWLFYNYDPHGGVTVRPEFVDLVCPNPKCRKLNDLEAINRGVKWKREPRSKSKADWFHTSDARTLVSHRFLEVCQKEGIHGFRTQPIGLDDFVLD